MSTSDQQNVIKFADLISKEGENNKCYVNSIYSEIFLKTLIKLLTSLFLEVLQVFYLKSTQREMGHSKGTWALEGHSRHLDTQDILFSTLSSAITRVAWHHRTSLIMSHDFYFDRIYWHQDCYKGNNIAINSNDFFHCCYKNIFSFYLEL